jgi:hypothetical protein
MVDRLNITARLEIFPRKKRAPVWAVMIAMVGLAVVWVVIGSVCTAVGFLYGRWLVQGLLGW